MELDELSKFEETKDPPLSGAYIRSLVKQLTTTKPKETMNTKDPCCAFDGSVSPSKNLRKNGKVLGASNWQQQQQHKKQVRRRLHTTRPYQERLLNMAEVRREIVTALKFHRAAMKQASEEQQQQNQPHQQQQQQEPSVVSLHHPSNLSSFDQQDVKFKSRRNPRIYPSCTTKFSNDFSYSSFSHPSLSVPTSSTSFAPSLLVENPNFTLPNQTLGLNLNLHDFNNLDTTLLLNNNNNNNNSSNSSNTLDATLLLNNNSSSNSSNTLDATLLLNNNNNNSSNSSLYSYSSSTTSSPPLSFVTDQEVPSIGKSQEGVSSLVDSTQVSEGGFHTTMHDEGMEEMRSLGELYQMEWNDTMNLVTSTLWFNFLKNMEHDAPPQVKTTTEGDGFHHVFDELIEIPPWLNATESYLEQCSEDYL